MENENLDMEILNRLQMTIFFWERQNVKTKKLSNQEMIEKIKKYIQQEVDRNDN